MCEVFAPEECAVWDVPPSPPPAAAPPPGAAAMRRYGGKNAQGGTVNPRCVWTPSELGFTGRTSVGHNNLGGAGPKFGAKPEIQFREVGTYKGKKLDLIVSNDGMPYTPRKSVRNGLEPVAGLLGQINLAGQTNARLTFTIVDHNDNSKEVVVDEFLFTFLDFDQSGSDGDSGAGRESAVLEAFTAAYFSAGSEVETDYGLNGGRMRVRGFSVGYEKGQCPSAAFKLGQSATQCDDGNPKSLSAMTEQQKNRAVSVLYKNTAKFAVAFAISASPKGRNLLFGLGDTLSGGCRV